MYIEGLLKPFGELALYQGYAQKMSEGLTPYIDFFPEYPPVALWLFKLANIFGAEWFTLMWYGMVALATVGIMVLIKKLKGNPYIYLACVLPLAGLYWDRFDVFAALFSLLAVYLAKRDYKVFPTIVLGFGIMTKIYPIILLPVILLMIFYKHSLRTAINSLIWFVIFMAIFISNSNGFVKTLFSYHGHRGIQIESIKSMPLLFKEDSTVEFQHGTYEIK